MLCLFHSKDINTLNYYINMFNILTVSTLITVKQITAVSLKHQTNTAIARLNRNSKQKRTEKWTNSNWQHGHSDTNAWFGAFEVSACYRKPKTLKWTWFCLRKVGFYHILHSSHRSHRLLGNYCSRLTFCPCLSNS